MNKRILIISLIVFVLAILGVYVKKQLTNVSSEKIREKNLILISKELVKYNLNDIGVSLLSPGELKKRDIKIKNKNIIKNAVVYEYNYGIFGISLGKFVYNNKNPDINALEKGLIKQLSKFSVRNTLKYTEEKADSDHFNIKIVNGIMKYKKLDRTIGFMAKLITKGNVFYQFIITYDKTDNKIYELSRRVFNSIKIRNE